MEELVRPWREQYRACDPSSFQSRLIAIPSLTRLPNALDKSVFSARPPLPSLPTLPCATRSASGSTDEPRPIIQLRSIPALDPTVYPLEGQHQAWCATTHLVVENLVHLPASDWSEHQDDVPYTKESHATLVDAPVAKLDVSQSYAQACFLALLRGLESEYFLWQDYNSSFVWRQARVEIKYLSDSIVQAIGSLSLEFGSSLKRLRLVQEFIFENAARVSTTLVALAVFLRKFLQFCLDTVDEAGLKQGRAPSLVSLLSIIQPVRTSVQWLATILALDGENCSIPALVDNLNPVFLLNEVEREVRMQTITVSLHDRIAKELLCNLLDPWMKQISSRISLGPDNLVQRGTNSSDVMVDHERIKLNLLTPRLMSQIEDIEKSAEYLKQYAEEDVESGLSRLQVLGLEFSLFNSRLAELEARLDGWQKLTSLGPAATIYGADEPIPVHEDLHAKSKPEIQESIRRAIVRLAGQPKKSSQEDDDFRTVLDEHGSTTDLQQVIRICLEYPIQLQALVINERVLDTLLHRKQLREHLELLHQVFLFRNHRFVANLSEAIFSHDGNSLNLKGGVAKVTRWPPRSAKVSMATRNILVNSIDQKYLQGTTHVLAEKDLLGQLGFAVTLEEESREISRDSLDALTFLTFSFRPPKSLQMIITSRSLHLYTRINQFLLLLMHMVQVVNQLRMETRGYRTMRRISPVAERFRIEATNFVRSFSAHVLETVIETQCNTFMDILDQAHMTIPQLHHAHLSMLEQICNSALISSKMSEMQRILREVFAAVLSFSLIPMEHREDGGAETQQLYATFDAGVRKLVAVLAGAEATKEDSFAVGSSARFLMNNHWAAPLSTCTGR